MIRFFFHYLFASVNGIAVDKLHVNAPFVLQLGEDVRTSAPKAVVVAVQCPVAVGEIGETRTEAGIEQLVCDDVGCVVWGNRAVIVKTFNPTYSTLILATTGSDILASE